MMLRSEPDALTRVVVDLGRLALAFGRVDRVTYHEDGVTSESDTDHTVMLGLIACAVARRCTTLDVGKVAQLALAHDFVEVYAGDTNTLHAFTPDAQAAKAAREHAAFVRITEEFAAFPWLSATIAEYEARRTPEARFVKALDKLLPKITHILNGGRTLREQGISRDVLVAWYDLQLAELREYAADFEVVFEIRDQLIEVITAGFGEDDADDGAARREVTGDGRQCSSARAEA